MRQKNMVGMETKEEGTIIPEETGRCNREQAMRTMRLLEKGVRQAFLDGEVTVGDTEAILDRVNKAKERCESGDVSACEVLADLTTELTQNRSETDSQV